MLIFGKHIKKLYSFFLHKPVQCGNYRIGLFIRHQRRHRQTEFFPMYSFSHRQ